MWCGRKGIDCPYSGIFGECYRSACGLPNAEQSTLGTSSSYLVNTTTEKSIDDIKREAVKEFAEKVKEKALSHCRIINCYELKFIETTIDDLLYDWQGHPPVCKHELKIDELLKECEK